MTEVVEGMSVFWKTAHSNRPFKVVGVLTDSQGQKPTFRLKQDGKLFSTADAKNLIPVTTLDKLDCPQTFWKGDGIALHIPENWICIRGRGLATFYPPKPEQGG